MIEDTTGERVDTMRVRIQVRVEDKVVVPEPRIELFSQFRDLWSLGRSGKTQGGNKSIWPRELEEVQICRRWVPKGVSMSIDVPYVRVGEELGKEERVDLVVGGQGLVLT